MHHCRKSSWRSGVSYSSHLSPSLWTRSSGQWVRKCPSSDIAAPICLDICPVQIVISNFFSQAAWIPLWKKRLESRYWTDVALGCESVLFLRSSIPNTVIHSDGDINERIQVRLRISEANSSFSSSVRAWWNAARRACSFQPLSAARVRNSIAICATMHAPWVSWFNR